MRKHKADIASAGGRRSRWVARASPPATPTALDHLLGVLQLSQPAIALIAASYMLLGAYLSCGAQCVLMRRVLAAAVVVGFIVAFSFVINAYCDVAADSVNEPERPIPSGRVSRRTAGMLAAALAAVALGVATFLGPVLALFALGTVLLSVLYSYRLKSTVLLGNWVIGTLNASIVVYGALAAGLVTPSAWVVAALVLLGTVSQEILYTVRDREGDARAGVRTIATRFGEVIAVRLFQISALLFVGTAMLVWPLGLASRQYVYALVPCTTLPMVGIVLLLGRKATVARVKVALRVINAVWVTSLFPIALLR